MTAIHPFIRACRTLADQFSIEESDCDEITANVMGAMRRAYDGAANVLEAEEKIRSDALDAMPDGVRYNPKGKTKES